LIDKADRVQPTPYQRSILTTTNAIATATIIIVATTDLHSNGATETYQT
jgi:hypothetical protein